MEGYWHTQAPLNTHLTVPTRNQHTLSGLFCNSDFVYTLNATDLV